MIQKTDLPSIGIVHDWFATYAGSERVVEQLLRLYTDAQLHVLVDFLPEADRAMLGQRKVTTSFIQKMPFARKRFRGYLPLMPLAVEQFDLDPYDVVLSSNHAFAKGVLTRADQLHICYVHTPIRYAWDLHHQYLRESRLTKGVRSIFARIILHYLRMWDYSSAQRVDVFVANSRFVARRIQKTYGRPAHVVYPPVNVDRFPMCPDKQSYYLTASRLVPYKKMDILVEAFRSLPDKRLLVIGEGPMHKQIAAAAPANVQVLGYQPDEVLVAYMQHARAFLFAAEEDFGIISVEAQSCGTPVVAFGRGGSRETVVDGVTGRFFHEQTAESVADAIEEFDKEHAQYDPQVIHHHAAQFAPGRFRREFSELVRVHWRQFKEASSTVETRSSAWPSTLECDELVEPAVSDVFSSRAR